MLARRCWWCAQAGTGLYQKWVKSQHRRVAATGSTEDDAQTQAFTQDLANRFQPSMKHRKWSSRGGGGAASGEDKGKAKGQELRSKDQVRVAVPR